MEEYDDHVLSYYADLAKALVKGRYVRGRNGLRRTEYLSPNTRPSEMEARRALAALLNRARGQLADERLRDVVLMVTLAIIDSSDLDDDLRRAFPIKLISQRRSTGHSDDVRDRDIATIVHLLRADGATRDDALAEVAEACGRSKRQVEKIYDRNKGRLSTSSDS